MATREFPICCPRGLHKQVGCFSRVSISWEMAVKLKVGVTATTSTTIHRWCGTACACRGLCQLPAPQQRSAGERRRPRPRPRRLARIAPLWRGVGDAWDRWRCAHQLAILQSATAQHSSSASTAVAPGQSAKRRRSSDRSAEHHRVLAERAREAEAAAAVIQKTRQHNLFQNYSCDLPMDRVRDCRKGWGW